MFFFRTHYDVYVAAISSSDSSKSPNPGATTARAKQEIKRNKLLEGIKPGWEKMCTKYDPRHWMVNLMMICQADKKSPLFRQCIYDLVECVFDEDTDDRRVFSDWIIKRNQSAVVGGGNGIPAGGAKRPKKWMRSFIRRYIRAPEVIIPRLLDWHAFYSDLPDPLQIGRNFFVANNEKIFMKEMRYVQKGYLSDKPGVDYHIELPTPVGQPQRWRSKRTNSALEGWHLHYRRLTVIFCSSQSYP